ncbi:hypothetical protein ABEW34_16385 [Paenibacillus algorifonticola]|uniref:hypothetical protein n=1 Tax=Paenibacillus algorifonticola TaxID=684063 RepID=UPI003D2B4F81
MKYKNIFLNDSLFQKDPDINSDHTLNENMEYFQNNYPENFFYIDRFPRLVNDFDKYSQLEVFYSQDGDNDVYKSEEKKFISVISKLWVYSETVVESSIYSEDDITIQSEEHPEDPFFLEEFKTEELVNITNIEKLTGVLKLALRGKIWACLIINDLSIVIWCNDLLLGVYFEDSAKYKPLVQSICTTEGLYLRSFTEGDSME